MLRYAVRAVPGDTLSPTHLAHQLLHAGHLAVLAHAHAAVPAHTAASVSTAACHTAVAMHSAIHTGACVTHGDDIRASRVRPPALLSAAAGRPAQTSSPYRSAQQGMHAHTPHPPVEVLHNEGEGEAPHSPPALLLGTRVVLQHVEFRIKLQGPCFLACALPEVHAKSRSALGSCTVHYNKWVEDPKSR